MIRKDVIVAVLATFCLTSPLFMIMPTRSQSSTTSIGDYDPWKDVNDDGSIDIFDIVNIATTAFGTSGTPINKTALLLELQARIDSLNASLIQLQARVAALENRVPRKGRISISPTAFLPKTSGQPYSIHNTMLRGQGAFYAALQLPNGAKITNMTVVLLDAVTNGKVSVYLVGDNITTSFPLGDSWNNTMASVETTDAESSWYPVVLYDDTILDNVIDNNNCVYSLLCGLTYDDPVLRLTAVMLDYEYLQ